MHIHDGNKFNNIGRYTGIEEDNKKGDNWRNDFWLPLEKYDNGYELGKNETFRLFVATTTRLLFSEIYKISI